MQPLPHLAKMESIPSIKGYENEVDCGFHRAETDNDFQNALTFSTIVARTYQGDAEGNGLFLRGFEGKHGRMYGDDYFSGLTTIRFPVEAIR